MLKQFLMDRAIKQRWKKMQIPEDYNVEDYLKKIPEYFCSESFTNSGSSGSLMNPGNSENPGSPESSGSSGEIPSRKFTLVYEFHDSGKNDGAWTVTVAVGKCTLTKGASDEYDTLIYMTVDTYRRILTGKLEHTRLAYSIGAVRYFGNTLTHSELNTYLKIPKTANIAAL